MKVKNKIQNRLALIYIIIASFFSLQLVFSKIGFLKKSILELSQQTIAEKYMAMDGGFYQFASFCFDKLPARCEVIFYNSLGEYKKFYSTNIAHYLFDYHKQRIKFYLYPIRVQLLALDNPHVGRPWEILKENESQILQRADFIIAYFLDRSFPGFKVRYKFGRDYLILAKE
ncbi:MAG: hypothetical protein DRP74_07150 [Candidatus Omnitrophota bacterium]|nr:MAG: hypothetical protein DRP74_07150 [Candidatus Omnitrophota bacterium]